MTGSTHTHTRVIISRRPKRESVIGKEDILNLKIALETSKTWDELLQAL